MQEIFESKLPSEISEVLLSTKTQVSFTNDLTVKEYLKKNRGTLSNSMINYYSVTEASKSTSQASETSSSDFINEERTRSVYYDIVTDIAGLWGRHRFEKNPYSHQKRPFENLKKAKDFDENIIEGELTRKMIGPSLSYLDSSPKFQLYALCKCILSEKDLVDISVLASYHFIQYLDLSYNKLSSLEPLGKMPFLQYLDASHNVLVKILDFDPPFYLSFVNYSHNLISDIPDLSVFWSIVHLDLSHNRIDAIKGLQNLKFLNHLDISDNKIEKIENLNNLRIQTLILSNNAIREVEHGEHIGLKTLNYLRFADLSNNNLEKLEIFQGNTMIANIKMSENLIQNLMEVYYLSDKRFLTQLDLSRNPICLLPYYKQICIRTVPNVKVFDTEIVTPEEHIMISATVDNCPNLAVRQNRMLLLTIEQANRPQIGNYIVPYDQPPPQTIILVGPPASKKKIIANEFVCSHNRLVRGVSYTTRPKTPDEEYDNDYYFISKQRFQTKLEGGEFITVSEFNGYSYAIAYKELEKAFDNKVIVFFSDLMTAFSLKLVGLRPKLVLAIPRSEEIHLKWIAESYHCENINSKSFRIRYGKKQKEAFDITEAMVGDQVFTEMLNFAPGQSECYREDDPCLKSVTEKSEQYNVAIQRNQPGALSGILKKCSKDDVKLLSAENMDEVGFLIYWRNKLEQKKVSWMQTHKFDDSQVSQEFFSTSNISWLSSGNKLSEGLTSQIASWQSSNTTVNDSHSQSVSEKTEQKQLECIRAFYDEVMRMRTEMLNIHWENPGLFREIIFTEETAESLKKLKNLLKNIVQNYPFEKNTQLSEDEHFLKMIEQKIQSMDLQKPSYFANN